MMEDTWESRELPVLRAIVEISDEGVRDMDSRDVAKRVGLDLETTLVALFALAGERPPLFKYEDASDFDGRDMCLIREPSGHARRTVGTWPTPETLADRLVQAMQQAADQEPDEEKRGWLRKTADWLGSAGRDIAVDVAGTALAKTVGAG
ncbi:hypothetical protein [Micromonospora endolithica]|uniref:Uncharacterized protein n=1 Tax=Micromonospora endolithica TaxID=230091 RepID=A0A3A9ZII4_9ACTN|nr:hypothetical protein [Micromonospora endolithica]RKN48232.1 hypothetical protein D7223_09365 [Micromonospora endolithica]TWJ24723.1 hypothetical protein JD76_04879 [Micromonospora endolithica]